MHEKLLNHWMNLDSKNTREALAHPHLRAPYDQPFPCIVGDACCTPLLHGSPTVSHAERAFLHGSPTLLHAGSQHAASVLAEPALPPQPMRAPAGMCPASRR